MSRKIIWVEIIWDEKLYESKLYELKNYMSRNYMNWNYMKCNYMSRNYTKCYWAIYLPEAGLLSVAAFLTGFFLGTARFITGSI